MSHLWARASVSPLANSSLRCCEGNDAGKTWMGQEALQHQLQHCRRIQYLDVCPVCSPDKRLGLALRTQRPRSVVANELHALQKLKNVAELRSLTVHPPGNSAVEQQQQPLVLPALQSLNLSERIHGLLPEFQTPELVHFQGPLRLLPRGHRPLISLTETAGDLSIFPPFDELHQLRVLRLLSVNIEGLGNNNNNSEFLGRFARYGALPQLDTLFFHIWRPWSDPLYQQHIADIIANHAGSLMYLHLHFPLVDSITDDDVDAWMHSVRRCHRLRLLDLRRDEGCCFAADSREVQALAEACPDLQRIAYVSNTRSQWVSMPRLETEALRQRLAHYKEALESPPPSTKLSSGPRCNVCALLLLLLLLLLVAALMAVLPGSKASW